MTWAVWLCIPAVMTVLAAIGSWWRSRPKRALTTDEAVRAHDEFLRALAASTSADDRGLRGERLSGTG